jgi:type I restriction-modification system DNA methylase subunit
MPRTTEINPTDIADALNQVRDADSFLNRLLAETLNWPIGDGVRDPEEITYDWDQSDLRARDLDTKLVEGQIRQLQLTHDQPWGIFVLEFKNDGVFKAERGMTGILRQVLRGLVKNRNKTASLRSWPQENLLFICTHKYKNFRIAHFKAPKEDGRTARLAAFGWGPDIPARTACEFNLNHLGWPDDPAGFDQWSEAFNVEKVTKKFYREYSDEFEALRKKIKGLGTDTEDQKMFTQTLLNRLMFLRFIERKDWLTPPGGEDSKDYLRLLFAAGNYRGKSFYSGRLRKLFFEGLAVDGKQESEAIGKAVFLNGGLFEENKLDEKVADIDNVAFAPLLAEDGLFYRYNFTVQESTPLDVEVAVDPEMLGKVFEELVTGRHESGSYYTPRPVVSFMCREALKGYLTDAAKLPESTVAAFVDQHDTTAIDIPAAGRLVSALDHLKAVDPACGSGAYLLGLLHEMVDLYKHLYTDKLKSDDRSLHDLKLRIISNSIYGVDIDKFATNIAMLRLWLSLSVDSKKPLPLPNLEFKIETGDSLLGPDPSAMPDLFREQLQRRADLLVRLKDKYLKTHNSTKHHQLDAIRKEERDIAKAMGEQLGEGIIDWRIQFAEVFAGEAAESTMEGFFPQMNRTPRRQMSFTVGEQRGGFDVVLANPPYVRQESIVALKPQLQEVFPKFYSGTSDLYTYFYARALQCLRPGGILAFISSNKWFRAGYGKKLRAHIANTASVRIILDFHDLPVFESAIAYPMIFLAANRSSREGERATLAEPSTLDSPYPDVTAVVAKFGHSLPAKALGRDGIWQLSTSHIADRLDRMRSAGPALSKYINDKMYFGVKTSFNKAFILTQSERDDLVSKDKRSAEILKPVVLGRDVNRWSLDDVSRWLVLTKIGTDIKRYPAVFKHLDQWAAELKAREDQGDYWWELRPCAYYEAFESKKIMWGNMGLVPRFTLAAPGIYTVAPANIIASNDLYLLAVLNSSAAASFFKDINIERGGSYLEFKPMYVKQLPIPDASASDRKAIGALAQKCLDAAGVGCEAWDKEIDERVAALYGL